MRGDIKVVCGCIVFATARRQASLLARPRLHCCRAKWKWLEDVRLMQLSRAQASAWSVRRVNAGEAVGRFTVCGERAGSSEESRHAKESRGC